MIDKRSSNIELMRILAMFAIIAGHLTQQSGVLNESSVVSNRIFAGIFGGGAGIADNIFVLIGSWFLVDKKFDIGRILKIYQQIFCYCIPITLLMLLFARTYISIPDVVRGLFPYSGSPLWFGTCYISLLLFSPLLNLLLLRKSYCKKILAILFFINVIPSTFLLRNDFFYSGEIVWFCFLYLLMGYLKRYKKEMLVSKGKLLGGFLINYLFIIVTFIVSIYLGDKSHSFAKINDSIDLSTYFMRRYHTLFPFIASICLFFLFLEIKMKYSVIINFLAKGCFGIYILHQIPAFTEFMWKKIFMVDLWLNSKMYGVYYFVTVLCIFLVGSFIDFFRRKLIEPKILNLRLYSWLYQKINYLYITD